MHYYKLPPDTPLGRQLKKLLSEILRCEMAADALAGELSAVAYANAIDVDFGGISCLEFRKRHPVDSRTYELITENEDGTRWYAPNVKVERIPMLSRDAERHAGSYGKMVSDSEKPFAEVSMLFSRNESAALAGITLQEPSVEELTRGLTADKTIRRMLMEGIPVRSVLPDCPQELADRITRAQAEDRRIRLALRDERFRMVTKLTGSRRAINIYRRMQQLPVIPRGMLNSLAGFDNPNRRAGIAEWDGDIYLASAVQSSHAEPVEITAEEFETARSGLEAMQGLTSMENLNGMGQA